MRTLVLALAPLGAALWWQAGRFVAFMLGA